MISPDIARQLLALARLALEARVLGQSAPVIPAGLDLPVSGVFVTVHCGGELRGCLGSLDPGERLAQAILWLGADVAHRDHRFRPIGRDELARLALEISVLSTPRRVADPSEIEVGRDGVIVELGRNKGLLLPQVAVEHRWDREMLLRHASLKAGLDGDAWRRGASVWSFQAQVFADPTG